MGVTSYNYVGKRCVQKTDPLGHQYFFKYDGAGRLIEQKFAQSITRYAYDSLGRRSEESFWNVGEDKPVSVSFSVYDFADRVIEEGCRDGNGNVLKRRQHTYDHAGNKLVSMYWSSETDVAMVVTDYDTFGRPVKVIDPQGNITFTHYSQEFDSTSCAQVWVNTTIDPMGRQITQKMDAMDRIVEKLVKDPFGNMIAKEVVSYDLAGKREKCVVSVIEDGKEINQ